ncbi:MAG: hypothetical protein HIU89_09070 [Proteobacteria bacterium]|nr:hypothetical protein [Pseudomonadota bacterium]
MNKNKQAAQYIAMFDESLHSVSQGKKDPASGIVYEAASLLKATTGALYALRQPGSPSLFAMHATANLFSCFSRKALSEMLAKGDLKAWPTLFAKDALLHIRLDLERQRDAAVEGALIGTLDELERCASALLQKQVNWLDTPRSFWEKSFAIPVAASPKSRRASVVINSAVRYALEKTLRISGRVTTFKSLCEARHSAGRYESSVSHQRLRRNGLHYCKPGIVVLGTRDDGSLARHFAGSPFENSWRDSLAKTVAVDFDGKTYTAADIERNVPDAHYALEIFCKSE